MKSGSYQECMTFGIKVNQLPLGGIDKMYLQGKASHSGGPLYRHPFSMPLVNRV